MLDYQSPISMAAGLVKYIADPSTVRVRVLDHFGRAPSVEQCRNLRKDYVRKRDARTLCGERFMRFNCGHAYEPENTFIDVNGYDRCQTCEDKRLEKEAAKLAERRKAWEETRARFEAAEAKRKAEREKRAADREIIRTTPVQSPFVSDVLKRVAATMHITVEDLRGPSRQPHFVDARAIAVKLFRDRERPISFPQIATLIGRKDHTSPIHLYNTFDIRAKQRPYLNALLESLR